MCVRDRERERERERESESERVRERKRERCGKRFCSVYFRARDCNTIITIYISHVSFPHSHGKGKALSAHRHVELVGLVWRFLHHPD